MDKVYGICGTNKCKREVPSKEEYSDEIRKLQKAIDDTINDSDCNTTSTWSSEKIMGTFPIIKDDTENKSSTWSSKKIREEIPIIPSIEVLYPDYVGFGKAYSEIQKPTLYCLNFGKFKLVHLAGAFGLDNSDSHIATGYTENVPLATVPYGYEPIQDINHRFQASQDKMYLLQIKHTGAINFSRYGDIVYQNGKQMQELPPNPWLTCDLFYIAG